MLSHKFLAIGTQWQIDLPILKSHRFQEIITKINSRIQEFDNNYSRFSDASWVNKISKAPGTYKTPHDFYPLIEIYKRLFILSNRKFTPLIGQIMEDAGYGKEYTLKQKKELTTPPDLTDCVKFTENQIIFKEKTLLDVGAAGKGYLVDIISKLLVSEGINSFCVDAGGDIYYKSINNSPLKVGLEDPDDITLAIGVAQILDESICASAGNRRKWGEFHHTIDPITLKSPTSLKGAWVVAPSALIADALATCLILDPHPEHYKDFKFECVLLYKDNKAFITQGFPGEIFTS